MKGYLKTKQPNDVVEVTYLRNNSLKTTKVTLAKRTTTNFGIVGTLKEPTKADLKKYNLDYGLKIDKLTENQRLREAWIQNGIKEGTIVTKINNQKIYTIDDVERIKSELSPYEAVTVEIINSNG
jgi:S1-C subfamily serine protease